MRTLWTVVSKTEMSWDADGGYGMGWGVVPSKEEFRFGNATTFYASHTGGAIGASSVLLVMPDYDVAPPPGPGTGDPSSRRENHVGRAPTGVVVAIIANMGSVGLNATAKEVARVFALAR
jgi:serine beta-lactamase-like protein LACTB